MKDPSEYELEKTEAPAPSEPAPQPRTWIAVALVAVSIAGVIAYLIYVRWPSPARQPEAVQAVKPAPSAVRPLGAQPEPIAVPPLEQSDPLVRDLVRKVTAHPAVLAWLATNGLIRNFAVVVDNVVSGTVPARHLGVLRLRSSFQVVERSGQLFIDPRSYERYDGIAAAAVSIDPAGAARLYATLKPRIEEAYGELGHSPASFDRALERAIVSLLQTPVVDGSVRVEPHGGVGYAFADPNLESLTPAQKHLLRTGPRNVRIIQSALRQLAVALGIPSERLPATR